MQILAFEPPFPKTLTENEAKFMVGFIALLIIGFMIGIYWSDPKPKKEES